MNEESTARDRAAAIVASLSRGVASAEEVFAAFEELDGMPPEIALAALSTWVGPPPDLERLDDEIRRAHRLPPRPVRLHTISAVKDADVLDMGPIAEKQLRAAGKSWDGLDLEPEQRLDDESDGSFAGTLERRVLAEGDVPRFDVMLFAGDSGVVFRSGTTNQVAAVAFGVVEMPKPHDAASRLLRAAIQEELAKPITPAQAKALAAAARATAAAPPAPVIPALPAKAAKAAQLPFPFAPETAAPPEKKKTSAKKKSAAADGTTPTKKTAATKKKTAAAAPKKTATAKKKKAAAAPKKAATKKKAAAAPKKAATKKKAAAAPKKAATKKKAAAAPKKAATKKKAAAAPKKTATTKKKAAAAKPKK